MDVLKTVAIVLVVCSSVQCSQVLSVVKEVQHCFEGNLEPCLVNHAVDALVEVAGLQDVVKNDTDGMSTEEKLTRKLEDALSETTGSKETGRGMLRTYNKAWKYFLPLLIGSMLNLATFIPIVLTFLTFVAKSAFLSGKMALLLTGLNIMLKYWYPKWAAEAHNEKGAEHSLFGNSFQHNYDGYNSFQQQYPYSNAFQANGYNSAASYESVPEKAQRRVITVSHHRK